MHAAHYSRHLCTQQLVKTFRRFSCTVELLSLNLGKVLGVLRLPVHRDHSNTTHYLGTAYILGSSEF